MMPSSYLDNHKKTTCDFYHAIYHQNKRKAIEGQEAMAKAVQIDTMKAFIANLHVLVSDDNDNDELLYDGSDDLREGSVR